MSIALTAIVLQLTFWLNFQISWLGLGVIEGVLAIIWLTGIKKHYSGLTLKGECIFSIAGLTMGAGAIGWRFLQAKDLVLPAWTDSLHHVLIVRLILENGRLPVDFSPYMPTPFFYHFGFHGVTAVFSIFSGTTPDQSVLIMGQILNGLIALAVFRLAYALCKDWRVAFGAGALAGFATHMPGYFLTWGRYTLVTALVLLPLAMTSLLEMLEPVEKRQAWFRGLTTALLMAGVLFTHYLAAYVLAIFGFLIVINASWTFFRQKQLDWSVAGPLLGSGIASVLLCLPWILRIYHYTSHWYAVKGVALQLEDQAFRDYASYLWYLAGPNHNYPILAIGLVGIIALLLSRKQFSFAVWSLIVAMGALPAGLYLQPFKPEHLLMLTFMPASILCARLLVCLGDRIGKVMPPPIVGKILAGAAILFLLIWGARDSQNILNPGTVFTTAEDAKALAWIKENTPADARFYINVVGWRPEAYRGVDGGWWILPITGRGVLVPPIIYEWQYSDYNIKINQWASVTSHLTTCSPEFWSVVKEAKLNYLYLRKGSGSLQPDAVQSCKGINEIYQQGNVWIYALDQSGLW
ncbi:MAG TPA: hypothetical protein PK613_13460 [Anaerolineaceae bacterium]|nr:hypothetical protein [Anaerolineaceae bacterium]